MFIAAVAGDQVGYLFGNKVGPSIFNRPDSRFFKQEHVDKAQEFFDKHGPKAIVLARFVPVVRTFCPVVAGVGKMHYSTFVRYNVVGGFLWGVGVTLLGYFFGQIEVVEDNFEIAILAIIADLGDSDRGRGDAVPPARRDARRPESDTLPSPVDGTRTVTAGTGSSTLDAPRPASCSTCPKHPVGGPLRDT